MRAVRVRTIFMVAAMVGTLIGVNPIGAFAAPGDLDTTFDGDGRVTTDVTGSTDVGSGVAVQADGKVVAVGQCSVAGSYDFCVVRYNLDGSLDASFGTGGKVTTSFTTGTDFAARVAIQPDGRIVAVGRCQVGLVGNTYDSCLARYTSAGVLDATFGSGGKVITDMNQPGSGDDFAGAVAIHAGKILVGGTCSGPGDADSCFARYNADGTLDTTFDETENDGMTKWDWGTTCYLNAMAVATDGRFYGVSQCGSSTIDIHVARYASTGTPDESDSQSPSAGTDVPFAAVVQADGKLIVAGSCNAVATSSEICLLRYGLDANLTLDTTFSGDGLLLTNVTDFRDIAVGVSVTAGGEILTAGRCEVAQNLWDFCALRYAADGSLDTGFGGDGIVTTDFASSSDQAISSAMYADGRLVLIGQCGSPVVDFCLARYQSDDSEAPVVTITVDAADTEADSGWYNAATSGTDGVLVNVSATDQTGVASIVCSDGSTIVLNITTASGSFALGDGQHTILCFASDGTNLGAGTGSSAQPVELDIDQTAPIIACFEPVLILNAAPDSIVMADLDDATSGTLLTSWNESAPETSTPGSHPVLVAADDRAGNVVEETCAYQVVYDFDGFHAPISSGSFDYINAVTGKLIPFRFTLTDALGQPVLSVPGGASVTVASGTCTGTTPGTLAASDYPRGKALLHNLGNGLYEYRWRAPRSERGQCRLVSITLADGVAHSATFHFAP